MNRDDFWRLDAVMWTEPSSGWCREGKKVFVYCEAIRDSVVFRPRDIVTHNPAFVVAASEVVFQAEAVFWRHLSGWRRASQAELQDVRAALHPVICRLLGFDPGPLWPW